MGLFNKVIDSYKESLRKDFLKLNTLKEVKYLLEKRGFVTSRIYGYKNVKRITATNSERNRLDFIFSDKNKYIILNYGFSNAETRTIEIVSTSKRLEETFNPMKLGIEFKDKLKEISEVHFNYRKKTTRLTFKSMDVFLVKNEIYADTKNVSRMRAVNRMFNIRNKILEFEIDKKRLKPLKDISGEKRRKLFKRVLNKLAEFLYKKITVNYENDLFNKSEVSAIFDIEFIKGAFFLEEFFLKYSFSEEDFMELFFNSFSEYLYLNIDEIIGNIKEKEIKEKEKDYLRWNTKYDKRKLEEDLIYMKKLENKESNKLIKLIKDDFFNLVRSERVDKYSQPVSITDEMPF